MSITLQISTQVRFTTLVRGDTNQGEGDTNQGEGTRTKARDVPSYSLPRVSRGATVLNIREYFILIQQALIMFQFISKINSNKVPLISRSASIS